MVHQPYSTKRGPGRPEPSLDLHNQWASSHAVWAISSSPVDAVTISKLRADAKAPFLTPRVTTYRPSGWAATRYGSLIHSWSEPPPRCAASWSCGIFRSPER